MSFWYRNAILWRFGEGLKNSFCNANVCWECIFIHKSCIYTLFLCISCSRSAVNDFSFGWKRETVLRKLFPETMENGGFLCAGLRKACRKTSLFSLFYGGNTAKRYFHFVCFWKLWLYDPFAACVSQDLFRFSMVGKGFRGFLFVRRRMRENRIKPTDAFLWGEFAILMGTEMAFCQGGQRNVGW